MNPNPIFRVRAPLAVLALFLALPAAQAQWQKQSMTLKPGWNAVFLHVDASYTNLDAVVGPSSPIKEIWLWNPPSKLQFVTTPQDPVAANSQWAVWDRGSAVSDTLTQLIGNAAYLVNNTGTVDYVWNVTGKPVAPNYQWSTLGLNFLGFPTPSGAAPRFSQFLAPAPAFKDSVEIYRYPGGNLAPDTNPVKIVGPVPLFNAFVNRGEAFWIRSTDPTYFNRYYSPVDVSLQTGTGVDFGDRLGTYSLRLRNNTATAQSITVSLLDSEAAPAGLAQPFATPPLLVRGAYNITNQIYASTVLAAASPQTFTVAPSGSAGSDIQVVLGLNRQAMLAPAGRFYGGILRFKDAGGLSQIDVPVTATVGGASGLWVGEADVTQVAQYLKDYQLDANGNPVLSPVTTNGAPYVSKGVTTALGAVAKPMPLRLIIHNDVAGQKVSLLQRVFVGTGLRTNLVVATRESFLNAATIGSAHRISAAHLPFALTNTPWAKSGGAFGLGTNVTFDVTLDYNDHASNPFLHTFHPDHDNLKADFRTVEDPGVESYTVVRHITLAFTPPANDFTSLTASTDTYGGDYAEVMTFHGQGDQVRSFNMTGRFLLKNISTIPTLTTSN